MTINKYQGKTKEEAVEKAKQELGAGAVVLNVKEIKPKGMFKMFKNTLYEVTAAVEEKEAFPAQTLRSETKPVHDTISLAADEKITIPGVAREHQTGSGTGTGGTGGCSYERSKARIYE